MSSKLKVLLLKILEEFEVPLQNVLFCVTDNTANMIKIVKDFNIDLAAESKSATSAATNDQEPNFLDEDEAGLYVLVKSLLRGVLELRYWWNIKGSFFLSSLISSPKIPERGQIHNQGYSQDFMATV
jgi:hypothetical protein